jgi:8-oxo-dGTP pyrophosphatase MutT (NUDIX family)
MVADWKLKSTKPLHDYRIFRTRSDTRVSPRTGIEHEFYVLESPDWVNIVAVTDAEEIVLINQFRHGISSSALEIPGGMVDEGEAPILSAERELLEETGYAANEFIEIGKVHPNPALFDNLCYTFLAKSAKKIKDPEFEGAEDIETTLYPSKDIMELIQKGEITHSLVLNALFFYMNY